MLDKVTLTGADSNTEISDLVNISKAYPFVEWGILVSRSQIGTPRFPDENWQKRFRDFALDNHLQVSCHLCGSWVRDLLKGEDDIAENPPPILQACQRVQINTHGQVHEINEEKFIRRVSLLPVRQIIAQYDDVNNKMLEYVMKWGLNGAPLFDLSHGAGILPDEWPEAQTWYNGYAGGLSPENLEQQMPKIIAASKGRKYWIDAETKIRTEPYFDTLKCTQFLAIAKKYLGIQP